MIEVAICDDHELVRRGVRHTLESEVDIRVAGEAADYQDLRELIREKRVDVLLLDLNLKGRSGMEILQALRDEDIKILVVSMHPEDQQALRCLRAGADGYLQKTSAPSELIKAIRLLMSGRRYLTATIAEMLVDELSVPNVAALHDTLSERELQTLKLIAEGKRLTDIASDLILSPKTVSVYRSRLLEKLGLSTNGQLIVYAIKHHLN
ncbi:MAG: response regulator [Polaromonas sp.]|jgi:two-component system invasion response regulator UvrY